MGNVLGIGKWKLLQTVDNQLALLQILVINQTSKKHFLVIRHVRVFNISWGLNY